MGGMTSDRVWLGAVDFVINAALRGPKLLPGGFIRQQGSRKQLLPVWQPTTDPAAPAATQTRSNTPHTHFYTTGQGAALKGAGDGPGALWPGAPHRHARPVRCCVEGRGASNYFFG